MQRQHSGSSTDNRFFLSGSQRSWDRLSSGPQEPVAATGSSSPKLGSPRDPDLGLSTSGTFVSGSNGAFGRGSGDAGLSSSGAFGAGSATTGSRNDGSEFRQRLKELGIGVDKGYSPPSQMLDMSSSWAKPSQSEASTSRVASPARFDSRGDVGISSTLGLGLSSPDLQPSAASEAPGPYGRDMNDSGPLTSTASGRGTTTLGVGNGSVKDLGPPARGWEDATEQQYEQYKGQQPQFPHQSSSSSANIMPAHMEDDLRHPRHQHHHHQQQQQLQQQQRDYKRDESRPDVAMNEEHPLHHPHHHQQGPPTDSQPAAHHHHYHHHQGGLDSQPVQQQQHLQDGQHQGRQSLGPQQQKLLQEPRPASPPPEERSQQQLQLQQEQEQQWHRRQQQLLLEQQGPQQAAQDSNGAPADEITSLGRMESEVHRSQIRLLREQVQALTREVIKLDKDIMLMKSAGTSQQPAGGGGDGGGAVSPQMQSEGAAYIQGLEDRIIALERACSADGSGQVILEDFAQRMQETWKKLHEKQETFEHHTAQDLDLLRRKIEHLESFHASKAHQCDESSRVDKLQDAVSQLDALLRKDIEERMTEDKRLWSAIENHTHDLDVSALCLDQHSGRWQEYPAAQEPVQSWSPSKRGGQDAGTAVRLAAPGVSDTTADMAANHGAGERRDRNGSNAGPGGDARFGDGTDVGSAARASSSGAAGMASTSGSVTVLDPPRVVNGVSFRT